MIQAVNACVGNSVIVNGQNNTLEMAEIFPKPCISDSLDPEILHRHYNTDYGYEPLNLLPAPINAAIRMSEYSQFGSICDFCFKVRQNLIPLFPF